MENNTNTKRESTGTANQRKLLTSEELFSKKQHDSKRNTIQNDLSMDEDNSNPIEELKESMLDKEDNR